MLAVANIQSRIGGIPLAHARAAIVTPLRTAIGSFGGALRDAPAEKLAGAVVAEVVRRSGIDPERVDDVSMAQSYANSEAPCIGRWVALDAGLPIHVPGLQIDRRCGGGLQAVLTAAMMVETGAADAVIAGGVESMSNVEHYTMDGRWGRRTGDISLRDRLSRGRERAQPEWRFGHISGMVETADLLASEHEISRSAADEYAVTSHLRAAAATANGNFQGEIVSVEVVDNRGRSSIVETDGGIRPDVSIEKLSNLKPIRPAGVTTAGNASQQNDAASACLVVREDRLAQLGLSPIATLVGWAAVGCDPRRMGWGPVPAVEKLFQRTGLGFDDMDLVELNEAFAAQVLAVLKGWNWADIDRLNVNGSAISLGHPIGATGARIMTSMLYELRRRRARYGLETMCIGGGQGLAAVFEAC